MWDWYFRRPKKRRCFGFPQRPQKSPGKSKQSHANYLQTVVSFPGVLPKTFIKTGAAAKNSIEFAKISAIPLESSPQSESSSHGSVSTCQVTSVGVAETRSIASSLAV